MATIGLTRSTLRPLPIGQQLTIVPDKSSDQEVYTSRVEDVLDSTVVVSMPMKKRDFVAPPKDTKVSAFFNLDGARYSFRAVVRGQVSNPLPVLFLADVRDIRKFERRSFARVNVIIEPTRLAIEGEDLAKAQPKRAFVVDVSAGGLGLVTRQPLAVGNPIDVQLDLPRGFGLLESRATVTWCTALDREGLPKWKAGASFRDLGPKDRDRLTAFVLQYQQALRRRGMI